MLFLSTLPARGATPAGRRSPSGPGQFLSTLPARGATLHRQGVHRRGHHFYPRSPRGERPALHRVGHGPAYFYPRSPRGERLRRALYVEPFHNISIHAPREGSDAGKPPDCDSTILISIHAPREGSDFARLFFGLSFSSFLSTLPARGATDPESLRPRSYWISIHAPREGSDAYPFIRGYTGSHFYPRSPRGERPWYAANAAAQGNISIHAPREGSDVILVFMFVFLS